MAERPGGAGRPVVLTADMDAVPLQDEKKVDYASKVPGVMHACGHDGHVAALLGSTALLASSDIPVRFVFRPAEEGTGNDLLNRSGAERLLEEGAFCGGRAIIGFHLDGSRLPSENLVQFFEPDRLRVILDPFQ